MSPHVNLQPHERRHNLKAIFTLVCPFVLFGGFRFGLEIFVEGVFLVLVVVVVFIYLQSDFVVAIAVVIGGSRLLPVLAVVALLPRVRLVHLLV